MAVNKENNFITKYQIHGNKIPCCCYSNIGKVMMEKKATAVIARCTVQFFIASQTRKSLSEGKSSKFEQGYALEYSILSVLISLSLSFCCSYINVSIWNFYMRVSNNFGWSAFLYPNNLRT